MEAWFAGRWKKDNGKEKNWLDQKYGLRRKIETENNCKSHYSKTI